MYSELPSHPTLPDLAPAGGTAPGTGQVQPCDPSSLPTQALMALARPAMELRALGFSQSSLVRLPLPTGVEIIVAISSAPAGEAVCRVTWCAEPGDGIPASTVSMITRFQDGENLITSSDVSSAAFLDAGRVATAAGASATGLWKLHCRRCSEKCLTSQPVLLRTYRELLHEPVSAAHHSPPMVETAPEPPVEASATAAAVEPADAGLTTINELPHVSPERSPDEKPTAAEEQEEEPPPTIPNWTGMPRDVPAVTLPEPKLPLSKARRSPFTTGGNDHPAAPAVKLPGGVTFAVPPPFPDAAVVAGIPAFNSTSDRALRPDQVKEPTLRERLSKGLWTAMWGFTLGLAFSTCVVLADCGKAATEIIHMVQSRFSELANMARR